MRVPNRELTRVAQWVLVICMLLAACLTACQQRQQPTNLPQRRPTLISAPLVTAVPTATPTSPPQAATEDEMTATAPAPTPTPTPTLEPTPEAKEPYLGIWLSKEELDRLPVSGAAWDQLKHVADQEADEPDLSDMAQMNDVEVLAKALVYARTGEVRYRNEVIDNLMLAIDTEKGGRTLAFGRGLVAYVIAADLINLPENEEEDMVFRGWLAEALTRRLDGRTLQSTHEERPNNWGTHAGASRAAIAFYLGDDEELARTAQVFKGWLGDRDAYTGFDYGSTAWQVDPSNPVGINPAGAEKKGYNVDGAMPEEMRRGGKFQFPPKETGYAWEALQGALVQAQVLYRAGYDTWEWENRALLRAVQFLYEIGWNPEGDDEWQTWLINYAYDTDFPSVLPARPGKNMAWTDWSHATSRRVQPDTVDN